MTKLRLQEKEIHTRGSLPALGSVASDFTFVTTDLREINFYSFKHAHVLLNIFPSIDTIPCSMSVRKFNKEATNLEDVAIINLSMDLPFAQKRFCAIEGITNVEMGSLFRSNFFTYYPLDIIDGPFKGLCSRAVIITNKNHEIIYTEQVLEISDEPDYSEALNALKT